MKFLVTGDTHGQIVGRLQQIDQEKYKPNETAVVILGDVGLNFYLNKSDERNKKSVNDFGYRIYCVRGNHEERPENINGMELMQDNDINGLIYIQKQYPNIRYLIDGCKYNINGKSVLVIGGAYSVDKDHRLARFAPGAAWTGWFEGEQLTPDEMEKISEGCKGKHFDFVFSHTCPYSWQPFDLFLSCVDQSKVDNTMEEWLDELKDEIGWDMWLFGHFHADRIIQPGVEMYSTNIEDLDLIANYWKQVERN